MYFIILLPFGYPIKSMALVQVLVHERERWRNMNYITGAYGTNYFARLWRNHSVKMMEDRVIFKYMCDKTKAAMACGKWFP